MNLIPLRLLIVISASQVLTSRIDIPEDATMTFSELAKKYGQKSEEYDVISKGGYILKVFRIPGDIRRPLLLIHGAVDSSDSFIMRGNTSLAIALARDNYDIWAMNYRGNRYSRRHIKMNPDSDPEFWDFSVHEVGHYDVPTTIDFILNKTGEQRLSVIGYSEGTTSMYVLGTTRPEYNDKIKIFIALAPICYMHNVGKYISLAIQLGPLLNAGLEVLRSEEVVGHNSSTKAIIDDICTLKSIGYDTCLINGLFLVTGSNPIEIEPEFFPIILGHFPAGTSRKNLNHLIQISQKQKFVNYDYGSARNMAVYKRTVPPEYDLSKVTMKIALFVAKNDMISTIKDVELLRKQLPNVVEYRVMKNSAFNHVDYIWGRNTHKTMFPQIFEILNKYQ